MGTFVQIAGAVLVLLAYVLGQTGRIDTKARSFLFVNLVGSALLAADALSSRQWGFFVLNGTWAVISLVNLVRGLGDDAQSDERST